MPTPRSSEWWRGAAVRCRSLISPRSSASRGIAKSTRLIITRTQSASAPLVAFFCSTDIRTDRTDVNSARPDQDHAARPDSLLGAFQLGDSTVLIPDLRRLLA